MLTRYAIASLLALALACSLVSFQTLSAGEQQWAHFQGEGGPGDGKHIVLVSGDEEYRSEEALPQLGKILAVRHGFECTVLFSVNPDNGMVDPVNQTNIPGIQLLADADMMVIATRFRELPDDDMKFVDDFVNSGKPILGLRTATHAFHFSRNKQSPYAHYGYNSRSWPGGFGQQVLGETWINHHGHHKKESTRGVINSRFQDHPILRGVTNIWGPTDVYGIKNLSEEAHVLIYGQVLEGMKPDDNPVAGPKNDPMMPIFWTREYKGKSDKVSRIICTTMGASIDLRNEGLRRAVINACYWGLGLEDAIADMSNVDLVGTYEPTFYGFGKYQHGVKPADHRLD